MHTYFMQLLQENRQISIFVDDHAIQQSCEEQAEAQRRSELVRVNSETNVHVRNLEAHADAAHRNQLSFVRESTKVLVAQLNSENQLYQRETVRRWQRKGRFRFCKHKLARKEGEWLLANRLNKHNLKLETALSLSTDPTNLH